MGSHSDIEWTDSTWSPLRSQVKADAAQIARSKGYGSLVAIAEKMAGHVGPHCEHSSPGCDNCYSETNNSRCLPANGTGLPFDRRSRDLVDLFLDQHILRQPLSWKRPRKIFVNSQTDTFGEFVPDSLFGQMAGVMFLCQYHTFQILTKRADRMFDVLSRVPIHPRGLDPVSHVWLGCSIENQEWADKRRGPMRKLAEAGWLTWVSYEPALGPVDWTGWEFLRWIVSGNESGREARPGPPDWHRDTRDFCQQSGIAYFFKQWGAFSPTLVSKQPVNVPIGDGTHHRMYRASKHSTGRILDGRTWDEFPTPLA